MKMYQHDFPAVEDYLHHRPPYLLVDHVVEVGAHHVITEKSITGDEFFLQGHFPGAPVFPGAMLQELTTQSAGILIAARYNPMKSYNTHDPFFNEYALGVLVRVTHARYKDFARPGDQLQVRVSLNERLGELFDFSARVTVGSATILKNGFQLTNVRSEVLQRGNR